MTRIELENKMAVLLGGRATESIVFSEWSTGAADDLAKATNIARSMVMRYRISEFVGHVSYGEEPSPLLAVPGMPPAAHEYSEKTAAAIDDAVRSLVHEAHERARSLLLEHREHRAHRAQLERGAARLLERETLVADNLRDLTGHAVSN
jgi:cell division protease FtsH